MNRHNEADIIRKTITSVGINYAALFGILTLVLAILFSIYAVIDTMPIDQYKLGLATCLSLGGFIVGGVLLWSWNRTMAYIGRIMDTLYPRPENNYNSLPEVPTDTYLPTETDKIDTFTLTTPSGVGEVVKELVNDFDPRDLRHLSLHLAAGNPYSEKALESFVLPYEEGNPQMGGLTAGTRLTKFLDLCERKEIMTARDAAKKKSGVLLIKDAKEIERRLLDPL